MVSLPPLPIPPVTACWAYKLVKHKSGGGIADGREMRVLITTQHIKTAADIFRIDRQDHSEQAI